MSKYCGTCKYNIFDVEANNYTCNNPDSHMRHWSTTMYTDTCPNYEPKEGM